VLGLSRERGSPMRGRRSTAFSGLWVSSHSDKSNHPKIIPVFSAHKQAIKIKTYRIAFRIFSIFVTSLK